MKHANTSANTPENSTGTTTRRNPRRSTTTWVAALLLAGAVTGCSTTERTEPAPATTDPAVTTGVFVEETFQSREHPAYHAIDCSTDRTVTFADGWELLSVAGTDAAPAPASTPISIDLPAGDRGFEITARHEGRTATILLRCLPEQFPKIELTGTMSGWTALTTMSTEPGRVGYRVILDSSGFPIWFKETAGSLADFTVVDGNLLTFTPGHRPVESFTNAGGKGFHLETLTGEELTRWVPRSGDGLDNHAAMILPNGNLLGLIYELSTTPLRTDRKLPGAPQQNVERCPDVAPTAKSKTLRGRVVEVTPTGEVVRTWRYEEHVSAPAASPEWINIGDPDRPDCVVDIEHLNGLVYYPGTNGEGNVLLTGRHVDGAVMFSWPSGEVQWRLGGTEGPDSLKIVNDPAGGPWHPHDANLLGDDHLVLYDNRANGETSRAVIYRIDPTKRTAELLESYSTSCGQGPCAAFAMGSTRPTADGTRVLVGWGTSPVTASEFERNNSKPVAELRLGQTWAYRVLPVPTGDPLEYFRAG
jgi:hypothetical protein